MSRAAARAVKGGAPKTPKDNTTGSTIKQYLAQGASPKSTHPETQKAAMTDKKKGLNGRSKQTPAHSRDECTMENILETTRSEEHRLETQFPTKNEISEMFKSLGISIKTEINMLRADLGSLLTRVEKIEDTIDKQAQELFNLKEQVKSTQQNQIKMLYRMEDQENRNRRQNLRIRGVPESRGGRFEEDHSGNLQPPLGSGSGGFPKHREGTPDRKI